MNIPIELVKGAHPGVILGRELKSRSIMRGHFAKMVDEFPQTLGAIIAGRRRMNTPLSLKIEEVLGIEEGYFMTLQLFHDIKEERAKNQLIPDLTKLRPSLFWECDIERINWRSYKECVISRVMEFGREAEQAEIIRFYGDHEVQRIMDKKE
ncbi:MAG: plasmid maintenance system antidote protein [Rikenellaceae bacterium]